MSLLVFALPEAGSPKSQCQPVDHLLRTHAWAAWGDQERAYTELNFCKQYREVKVVFEAACLLSERFSINGLPKTGDPIEVLDQKIQQKEWEALVLLG